MSYSEFIQNVKNEKRPGQFVLKESRANKINENNEDKPDSESKSWLETMLLDVVEPEFYADFAKLETIELM